MHRQKFIGVLICELLIVVQHVNGVFEFQKTAQTVPVEDLNYFSKIDKSYFLTAVQLGVQSIDQEERLESNLIDSNIVVTNGSISHAQYLETFPNEEARTDDNIARKILKSSLYILNAKCLPHNINGQSCRNYFSNIPLPESNLKQECLKITQNQRDGHHAFRRLLPANYKDGFYKMYQPPQLPKPREITNLGIYGHLSSRNGNLEEEDQKNLVLVQWTQFIEHDLSKSVVTSMKDGTPIECCDQEFFKLTPRYVHPACAPLENVSSDDDYKKVSCLNYVRSALAVNSACNFGAAEQLNQESGILDLSQLYGFTKQSQNTMRTFRGGKLKVSRGENIKKPLLPLARKRSDFCANNRNSTEDCFMAGDSRVNNNPFTIILYTIFLRNHNEITRRLKSENPNASDEFLYNKAKNINIDIYRYIIYNEWLPVVLGSSNAKLINSEPLEMERTFDNFGTSNEFALAAIRFYFSMMPNALVKTSAINIPKYLQENIIDTNNVRQRQIFNLKDQFYKSDFLSYPEKFNVALDAMLNQRAMKMDSNYAEVLTKSFLSTSTSAQKISGTDALAWDIQRGRDHGIQGYVKYLEICQNINVNDWNDLEEYIKLEDIGKLKSVYNTIEDIDLIVGGISEQPKGDSTLGPTFTCILGEQFSNIRKIQFHLKNEENENVDKTLPETNIPELRSAAELLCETTSLPAVPKNIFLAPSETNPLMPCPDL